MSKIQHILALTSPVNHAAQVLASFQQRFQDTRSRRQIGYYLTYANDTDLRNAHGIARRLSAVMRHTATGRRGVRSEPTVTVATLMPQDSPQSLLARLYDAAQRAAS